MGVFISDFFSPKNFEVYDILKLMVEFGGSGKLEKTREGP